LLSLKDAVTSGRFTISLSTGHKHTLYVFSDPMCPHCRALEPRLQELSKRYNVEIFPVSVYGDLRSMVRAAPVLDTGKDTRLKSWEDTINMGYTTMNPKIDDPKTAPDTTGARLVDANNMAFAKFGFIGTPSIVADSGDVIPVSVVKDDARLQQAIGE
ncbi:DsbC family protein, partial [Klebsiella pneumoniae]|jgi:TrbB protein